MAEEDWVHFFGLLILILCCYHVFPPMVAPDPSTFWVLRSYSCGNWTSTSAANTARHRAMGRGVRPRGLVLIYIMTCLLGALPVASSLGSASVVATAVKKRPGSPQQWLPPARPSHKMRSLAGLGHVARSEDPEARSPHCMELNSVTGKSVLLCDPTTIGEPRKGESRLCWTFDHTDLCSYDANITQSNYPGLKALADFDQNSCDVHRS